MTEKAVLSKSRGLSSPLVWIWIAFTLTVAALLVWQTITVLLLAFAGGLLAILLNGISRLFAQWIHWPYRVVLLTVLLCLLLLVMGFFWLALPLISKQLVELFHALPQAYGDLQKQLSAYGIQPSFKESLADELIFKNEHILSQLHNLFSFTVGTVTSFAIFVLLGVYLAYDPERYVAGFLALIPKHKRARVKGVLDKVCINLRWWIVSKLVAMAIIGLLTVIGLKLLDVPLAFILGLLIALLTFIPYIGAIIASIPAILIALSIDPWKALYVTLLYLGIHMIEGYLITPLVEQRTVSLAPALTVLAQLLLVILTGFIGLALASPLTVVAIVLVRELWIKDIS